MFDYRILAESADDKSAVLHTAFKYFVSEIESPHINMNDLEQLRFKEFENYSSIPISFYNIISAKIFRIINLLENEGIFHIDRSSGNIRLTEAGFIAGQELFGGSFSSVAASSHDVGIPASDRIVRVDHNAPDAKEALARLDDLVEALGSKPNDLPLSADEREIAIEETRTLADRLRRGFIRVRDVISSITKWGIFRWLGEKVGEHAIKALINRAIAAIEQFIRSFPPN